MRRLALILSLFVSLAAFADAAVPVPRGPSPAPGINRCAGRLGPLPKGEVELRGALAQSPTMICTADVPASACSGGMTILSRRYGMVELDRGSAGVTLGCASHREGPIECTLPVGTEVVVRGHLDDEQHLMSVDAICRV